MSAWTIFLAILVFSVIILFHEFGHFIVAKWNKVKVLEFSLGMGPRLISWVKTSEGRKIMFLKSSAFLEEHPEYNEQTIYSWKLLPFGGSCMMLGEEESVRETVAFPLNQNGEDVLTGTPNEVTEQQLRETHIKLR